jgi:hypothetical protein
MGALLLALLERRLISPQLLKLNHIHFDRLKKSFTRQLILPLGRVSPPCLQSVAQGGVSLTVDSLVLALANGERKEPVSRTLFKL